MRIAVIGAGGVGGYFGGVLARAGHDVRLLARGEHRDVIRKQGLTVREPKGTFTANLLASDDPSELGPADLALIAVKSYSLDEIAPVVRMLAEQGSVILPLLNGVEASERLALRKVPREQILEGLTLVSSERSAPGVVTLKSDFRSVVVGERGGEVSERALRAAAAFREAGVEARVSDEVVVDLWRKFLFIATLSAACGLARAPVGAVRAAPLGRLLLERAAREIGSVARARSVRLPEGEEDRTLERIEGLSPAIKPSFLLDLERGGSNELDVLSGAVSRYGRDCGVSTPIHDTATAAFSAGSS